MTQGGIHIINKREFLSLYTRVYYCAFSRANILSGFAATSLIPFKPKRVLLKLYIKIKILTPPSSLNSNQSFYLGRTLVNLY